MIDKYKVIPVVVINKLADTVPTLSALQEGELPIAEITFRTACAKDAIALAVKQFPQMLIGAGTIINAEQCKSAISVGAKFIVGPGFSASVADVCEENKIAYFPGCVTPTEIMSAISRGLNVIKFFPSGIYGGLKAMKALAGPFPQIKFIPTGGVDATNLSEYLAWEKIYAVGGSWMMNGTFDEIKSKCLQIKEIIRNEKNCGEN